MENKKYLPIKIVHLILMMIAIAFCCISLVSFCKFTVNMYIASRIVSYLAEIIALISGIVYLAYGYKKNAAVYYKAFMIILVISQAIFIYSQLIGIIASDPATASIVAILNIIPLIMLTILATGKDLGKTKSYAVVLIVFACRVGNLIVNLNSINPFVGGFLSSSLCFRISDILLAATALFMVAGKYLDKTERGTN